VQKSSLPKDASSLKERDVVRVGSSRPDPFLIRDLEWFLGLGIARCHKSTMGGMLERAESLAFDSDGNRIPLPEDKWLCMMPKKQNTEPFYELEFRELFLIGRMSRTMIAVASKSTASARVLEVLYGDAGARWGRTDHGRDAAIYHLTTTGQKVLGAIRRRFPTSDAIRDDEVIVQDFLDQKRAPNDIRSRQHRRIRNEADILKIEAHRALGDADRALEAERAKIGAAK
jgi:hypothetical protein